LWFPDVQLKGFTMQNPKFRLASLAIACAALAFATPASAQNARSWVSSAGLDSNSCLRAAPCATFAGALTKTVIGGQINCADPGDYGTPTIIQSVTIDCPQGFGNVFGIVINIPPSTMNVRYVTLRGLTVQGGSSGLFGVEIISAGNVNIDRMLLTGGFVRALYDHRSDSVGRLFVSNSTIENATVGIAIGSPGIMQVVLDNVQSTGSTYGLAVGARASVAVRRSVFSGNSVGVEGDAGAQLAIEWSMMNLNTNNVESNMSVRLSNSDVAFGANGVVGTAATFGNNRFSANASDGSLTPVGGPSSDLGER
jgi:hypothetical protein